MKKKVYDMLNQEITVGCKVLYFPAGNEFQIIRARVKDIKVKTITERSFAHKTPYDRITVTLDCGGIFGIKKIRNEDRLLVCDKLGIKERWLDK